MTGRDMRTHQERVTTLPAMANGGDTALGLPLSLRRERSGPSTVLLRRGIRAGTEPPAAWDGVLCRGCLVRDGGAATARVGLLGLFTWE